MHYLGMLAARLTVPVSYYVPTVVFSLLLAIVASAVALTVACAPNAGWKHQVLGGTLMGAGIGAMHYVGMAAMRSSAMQVYSPPVVALSVVTAVLIATLALRLLGGVREAGVRGETLRLGAGILMGLGVAAMHYLSMAAVHFELDLTPFSLRDTIQISSLGEIGVIVAATSVLLSGTALRRRRQDHVPPAPAGPCRARRIPRRPRPEANRSSANSTSSSANSPFGTASPGSTTGVTSTSTCEPSGIAPIRNEHPITLLMLDIDHF